MLVRDLKQLLVWIYTRYARSKGHLWERRKWLLDKWGNNRFAMIAIARALENILVSCLTQRSWCSLSFSFSSHFFCPPTLSQFHLLCPFFIFSVCPSHPLSHSNCPCFSPLFASQQVNSSSGACFAGWDCSLTSFSSQLRLSRSASALLSRDSHS